MGLMVDFNDFRPSGNRPIYLQIVDHVKRSCVKGISNNGDEMPSRRGLSALLGINPMTVQKAYRILEDEGLIESRAGSGSFITLNDERIREMKADLLKENIREITVSLKQMGISRDEAAELIKNYWEGTEENEK